MGVAARLHRATVACYVLSNGVSVLYLRRVQPRELVAAGVNELDGVRAARNALAEANPLRDAEGATKRLQAQLERPEVMQGFKASGEARIKLAATHLGELRVPTDPGPCAEPELGDLVEPPERVQFVDDVDQVDPEATPARLHVSVLPDQDLGGLLALLIAQEVQPGLLRTFRSVAGDAGRPDRDLPDVKAHADGGAD